MCHVWLWPRPQWSTPPPESSTVATPPLATTAKCTSVSQMLLSGAPSCKLGDPGHEEPCPAVCLPPPSSSGSEAGPKVLGVTDVSMIRTGLLYQKPLFESS
eukprot:m.188223 g.188223  ORF g.188223 m.188223 type:complete len:101 (+) comp18179_c0_seq3:936-1238(+)